MRWRPINPDGDWMDLVGETAVVALMAVAAILGLILAGHALGLVP